MKKNLLVTLCTLLIIFSQGLSPSIEANAATDTTVRLVIDGKSVNLDVAPIIQNGRTLLPFRVILEALDAEVSWDSKKQLIVAKRGTKQIVLQINNQGALVDNQNVTLDVAPSIVNGRTMVPARFVTQSLGSSIHWNEATRTVSVVTTEKSIEPVLGQPTQPVEIKVQNHEFVFKGIALGDTKEQVVQLLGQPKRTATSEYGFEWYIFHTDYKDYLQVGIHNQNVVAFYTNSKDWVSKSGLKFGSSSTDVTNILGKKIESIVKGTVRMMFSSTEVGVERYVQNNSYVTAFYDVHNGNKLTSIQVIQKEREEALTTYYSKQSDQLRSSFEAMSFDLANSVRVREGLSAFTWDEHMAGTSRKHSVDMASNNYFSHTNLAGKSPFDRMTDDGFKYLVAGENLAYGQVSPIFAHEGLMNSLGHRKNLLGDFERLGVGVAFGSKDDKPYFTQKFYTPR